MSANYAFRPYHREDLDAVAELQRFLLGPDIAANRAYLEWKYHHNPIDSRTWAIVATCDDDVVGFRGFVPSLWWDGDSGRVVPLLALADTCVHADHRRRGLFTQMTVASLEAFAGSEYLAIINLSTSARPAPGYLKLGWAIFGHHGELVRYTARGLVWRLVAGQPVAKRWTRTPAQSPGAGWELDDQPRPEIMARLVAIANPPAGRLSLARDATFYGWRFANPRERYRFAWAMCDAGPDAFLVIRDLEIAGGGAIIDYAATRPGRLEWLADRLLREHHYGMLSVWNVTPRSADGDRWRRSGFVSLDRLRRIVRRDHQAMPLLIRPLVAEPGEDDWLVSGHDLRDIDAWHLIEVCSDGA